MKPLDTLPFSACVAIIVGFFVSASVWAEPVPVEDFARQASYGAVRLSPDGQHLALTVPSGNQTGVAIIDLDERKLVGATGFGPNRVVADFWWVGNQRLIATPAQQFGSQDFPSGTGELIGFKYNGKSTRFLMGVGAVDSAGSHTSRREREYLIGRVIAPLPDDESKAIVSIDNFQGGPWSVRATRFAIMNTMTGARVQQGEAPLAYPSSLLANGDGEVVMAVTVNARGTGIVTHYRASNKQDWKKLQVLRNVRPDSVSADTKTAYVTADNDEGLRCLFALNLFTGESEQVICHPSADISAVLYATDTSVPIAVVAEPSKPEWIFVDAQHPEAKLLQRFLVSFSDKTFVVPASSSRDGKRWVLFVYGDTEPGVYYLFDRAAGKIEQIVARREWIDPAQMASVRPFEFEASDGQKIAGYVTVPQGQSLDALPAVVMPHGGPLGIRDNWGWDRDAQFLASRGYAVIQINFRGSAGYGRPFLNAGRKQWAGRMIDDITDGVRYLIDERSIDAKRICIYGASYGGYAALMSAVREPDLYRCAIGYVGVYDLKSFRATTDITESERGVGYFNSSVAGSDDEMERFSPITYLDKLKAPVMIVHGGEDRRVPVDQAQRLRSALSARNHPHEYYVEDNEGHGFYDPENVSKLLTRMETFLARYIGG